MPYGQRWSRCCRTRRSTPTRWAAIVFGYRTGSVSRRSSSVWPWAVRGSPQRLSAETGCRTPPCGDGATSGWRPGSSTPWWAKPLAGYDRLIGLELSECAIDGSTHKAPCGGQGTGKNPTDRGKLGWKWSLLSDRAGIPLGWAADGANRHDSILVPATLEAVGARGLLGDIETLHLDRGYDSAVVRDLVAASGIDDLICAKRRPAGAAPTKRSVPLGMRWPIERTNSWLANYGQLRRNTDRHTIHRLAQIALTVTVLLTAKLIDWRNRWTK